MWTYKTNKFGGVSFFVKSTECVARENQDYTANAKRSIVHIADLIGTIFDDVNNDYAFGFVKEAILAIVDLVNVEPKESWSYKVDAFGGVTFYNNGRVTSGCAANNEANKSVSVLVDNVRRSIAFVADLIKETVEDENDGLEFAYKAASAIRDLCALV